MTKEKRKKIIKIFIVLVVVIGIFLSTKAFAVSKIVPIFKDTSNGTVSSEGTEIAKGILSIIQYICIAVAMGSVIYLGIQYVIAPVEQKANIKNSMVMLLVGALLVFVPVTVVKTIISAANIS